MSVPGRRGTESKTAGLVAGPDLKLLDRVLRRWRTAMAAPYIPRGARVLDVGSNDGALFRHLARKISWGVGLDPALTRSARLDGYELVAGTFPADMPSHEPFDVITMLAVIEHIPSTQHEEIREACARLLKPGGLLLITAPSPMVDPILEWLARLRVIAGIALHEHHGFDPREIPELFSAGGFVLVRARRFQLGLNNLFVFRRAD